MTAQEAAYKILLEAGKPLLSREIAQLALDKGYASSSAKDPIFSIANTIEKNIRGGIYNSTQLVFVKTTDGRKIGLPSMNKETAQDNSLPETQLRTHKTKVTVELPQELISQVQLAYQAKLANSYDETVAMLIKKGLSSYASEIRERLFNQLEDL
jgi:hypothetical protein